MFWAIGIAIVGFILFRFFSDVNKDNDDLTGQALDRKFAIIVEQLNLAAFGGNGVVTTVNKRNFNLYQEGKNQFIRFTYGTGHLTIIWKYKYYQKEVVHEKTFHDVRNLSIFEQQRIADNMMSEMAVIIQRHQNNVVGY
ncbi:hypothetical protein [Pedobacter frigiditerrae]|uniref:hypothetical protein n=1 Tax=Pedobacter frigiditerrae TaxID=2530452 RepID=UPI0029302402|nr:hypothetical protein [Pedobacter frigiditerrae]